MTRSPGHILREAWRILSKGMQYRGLSIACEWEGDPMKVGEIMNRAPVTVRNDQTFGEAFRVLVETRHTILPVVDADGVYRGIFDLHDIWTVLLPKAAKLSRKSIEDLSFVSSSLEKMKEQIADSASLPIEQFVTAADVPPIYPDSPVIQAVLLLDEFGETIAVVDRQTKKLVGVIAAWQVLDILR
jgi:CBS domain-containing protein